jgi:hypothetical protein
MLVITPNENGTRSLQVLYNFGQIVHNKIPDMSFECFCFPIMEHAIQEKYLFTLILEDVSPLLKIDWAKTCWMYFKAGCLIWLAIIVFCRAPDNCVSNSLWVMSCSQSIFKYMSSSRGTESASHTSSSLRLKTLLSSWNQMLIFSSVSSHSKEDRNSRVRVQ